MARRWQLAMDCLDAGAAVLKGTLVGAPADGTSRD